MHHQSRVFLASSVLIDHSSVDDVVRVQLLFSSSKVSMRRLCARGVLLACRVWCLCGKLPRHCVLLCLLGAGISCRFDVRSTDGNISVYVAMYKGDERYVKSKCRVNDRGQTSVERR
jgi:hypothetical protein